MGGESAEELRGRVYSAGSPDKIRGMQGKYQGWGNEKRMDFVLELADIRLTCPGLEKPLQLSVTCK